MDSAASIAKKRWFATAAGSCATRVSWTEDFQYEELACCFSIMRSATFRSQASRQCPLLMTLSFLQARQRLE